jgi:hypothetical protein
MKSDELEEHIRGTYFGLRVGLVVMAFLFPIVLWGGGRFGYGLPLQGSMSAYYHANMGPPDLSGQGAMRNWFVGVLFAVGACLYLYKGFSKTENVTLNSAGIFAVGIALFPMPWPEGQGGGNFSLHGFCAVTFFLCIAFVCLRCAHDTLRLIQDPQAKRRFTHAYHVIGIVMIASPAIAVVLTVLVRRFEAYSFWVEVSGIYAFAAYWLTKSREMRLTEAERLGLHGTLAI